MNQFLTTKKVYTFMAVAILLTYNGCSSQPDIPRYRGYSFDAMVDGVKVVELKDRSKIPALQGYVRDVKWQTVKPISGYLNVSISPHSRTSILGNHVYIEDIEIVPLSDVSIKTYRAFSSDNSVLIGGKASVTDVNVMKQKKLPAGEYVIRVKIHGSKNWDRKEIYTWVQ